MNQTATSAATAHEPGTLFKTPKQLITAVILAFMVPVIIILLLVNLVTSANKIGAGSDALHPEAIALRIKPVANFTLVDVNAPKLTRTGQQVYESTCSACHGAGIAGAPKFGDAGVWTPLIAAGLDAMLKVALEGKGAMPAKGGNPGLSDFEIERAVVYMANQSGGSFAEPVERAQDGTQPTDVNDAVAATAGGERAAAASE